MDGPIIPQVSVVIASHRRDAVRKCVGRFTRGGSGKAAAETIVVADYPVGDMIACCPEVVWVYCPDISIPKKRNVGIARARGAIVGFIDDDCEPLDNWVDNALRYLRDNPEHAGVEGHTAIERREGVAYPAGEFKRLETPSFRTNNIFYRKEILLRFGCFDERFSVQREDIDLAFSILESGLIIGYCPDIRVAHGCREGERWDLLKNCRNRRFDPLLYKKHRSLYRKWIATPVPPGIELMLAMHCLLAAGFWYGGRYLVVAVLSEAIGSLAMAMRRNSLVKFNTLQIACDCASFIAAPFVLFGALVYGSLKFKKLLIF
jgi:hypothetical protein